MALSPTFSSNVEEYTAETSEATAKVTASADSSLTVALTFNDVAIENEDTVTFEDGENVLEVTVTNSASEEKVYTVTITKDDPAKLSGLTIGALTLTPTFDDDVEEYTVATSNASDKVTASAAEGLDITILLGETEIENESSPSWEEGENVLTITVSNTIDETTVYTVTVTKDAPAKLTGLTIGALTLTPTFDADVEEYTVTTSNASNKVTATAAEGLTVELDLDGTAIENESSPSWEVGPNILTVTVENGIGESTSYVVTVTKTE